MADIRIVLVGSKYEGNVGAVARSMANFGLDELVLVGACELGDDAYRRAKHASPILENATVANDLRDAIDGCRMVVGTSAKVTEGQNNNYLRIPITVKEFKERIDGYDEKIALVFGREDCGLLQDELAMCDILVTIPSDPSYSALNISHAATILMYELYDGDIARAEPADTDERERMMKHFDELLDAIQYPEHRRETTSIMFRRMIGRSVPTKWEFNTIMGVFGDAAKRIRK